MGELGWDRTTVAKLEAGYRANVTVDELGALAAVFDVQVETLLARVCPHCGDCPPSGYTCNSCRTTTPG